jgi:hypothetical protein
MQISTSVGVAQAMIASFEFALPSIYQFLGPDQDYPARTGVLLHLKKGKARAKGK